MAVKPGTFEGMLNAGPNAGKKFSIEGESRLFRVSDDRKKITVAIDKPYVQKIIFSGDSQPVPRSARRSLTSRWSTNPLRWEGANDQVDCEWLDSLSVATPVQAPTLAPIPLPIVCLRLGLISEMGQNAKNST
jgi:hypothetical protein